MLSRRNLIPAAVATAVITSLPQFITTEGKTASVPHVYLARSELITCGGDGRDWLETWRHTGDPKWSRSISYSTTMDFPYDERLAVMSEEYARYRQYG